MAGHSLEEMGPVTDKHSPLEDEVVIIRTEAAESSLSELLEPSSLADAQICKAPPSALSLVAQDRPRGAGAKPQVQSQPCPWSRKALGGSCYRIMVSVKGSFHLFAKQNELLN